MSEPNWRVAKYSISRPRPHVFRTLALNQDFMTPICNLRDTTIHHSNLCHPTEKQMERACKNCQRILTGKAKKVAAVPSLPVDPIQSPAFETCSICGRSDGLHNYHEQSSPQEENALLRKALTDILGCSSLRKAWSVAEEALKDG